MLSLLLIWLGIVAAVSMLGMRGRPGSAGLPLAYFLGLSLIHVPGAFFCLDSEWSDDLTVWTRTGFEQTIIGIRKQNAVRGHGITLRKRPFGQ